MDADKIKRVTERKVSEDSYGNQNLTIAKTTLENIDLEAGDKAKVISTNNKIIIRSVEDG